MYGLSRKENLCFLEIQVSVKQQEIQQQSKLLKKSSFLYKCLPLSSD